MIGLVINQNDLTEKNTKRWETSVEAVYDMEPHSVLELQ